MVNQNATAAFNVQIKPKETVVLARGTVTDLATEESMMDTEAARSVGDSSLDQTDTISQGNLVCGSNNCKKFGSYYHEKDDCCDLPENLPPPSPPVILPGTPLAPPPGQRCRGRNYDGRRCCTPENPCQEGEGDCDGFEDGGVSDGNRGCKPGLVCGSNNCKKFGAYYPEKDDSARDLVAG